MKKIKKLLLKKEIITNLSPIEMNGLKGGEGTFYDCFTNTPACNENYTTNCTGGGGSTSNCYSYGCSAACTNACSNTCTNPYTSACTGNCGGGVSGACSQVTCTPTETEWYG